MAGLSKVTAIKEGSVDIFICLAINCFLTQLIFNGALLTSHIIISTHFIKWKVLVKGYILLLAVIYQLPQRLAIETQSLAAGLVIVQCKLSLPKNKVVCACVHVCSDMFNSL